MSFWGELSRRNVFKVGVAYLIVAWLLAQVVSVVRAPLGLPMWFETSVIVFLAVGFPVALLLAWAYEVTPEGIKRTKLVPLAESITHVTGQKLNYVVTGLLVVAVAFLAFDDYVLDSSMQAPREESALAGLVVPAPAADETESMPLPNSIAVLPFANLSPDPDNEFFAAGIHDEILNQLAKLKNLNVIARTSVMEYRDAARPITDIAHELNVETVMEGSVSYAEGRVAVRAQLIDARTGVHLWSDSYNEEFANIFGIQADIAMSIANAMRANFTTEEQALIEAVPTESRGAYQLYLSSRELQRQQTPETLQRAVEQAERAVALDPEFREGWLQLAEARLTAALFSPGNFEERMQGVVEAGERVIELDPDAVEAFTVLAALAALRGDWLEAGRQSLEVRRRGSDNFDPETIDYLLGTVPGNAVELMRKAQELDPLNRPLAADLIHVLDLKGDPEAAVAEYQRFKNLFGDWGLGRHNALAARLGMGDASVISELPYPGSASARLEEAIVANIDDPAALRATLREFYDRDESSNVPARTVLATWAAYFDEDELALDSLEDSLTVFPPNAFRLWSPIFRDVRRLPRFKDVMREHGLVEYWRVYGWNDSCSPVGDGDFECQ